MLHIYVQIINTSMYSQDLEITKALSRCCAEMHYPSNRCRIFSKQLEHDSSRSVRIRHQNTAPCSETIETKGDVRVGLLLVEIPRGQRQ